MLQAHASSPFRWNDRSATSLLGASKADRPLKAPVEQGKNDE